jgi:hypothetical protein
MERGVLTGTEERLNAESKLPEPQPAESGAPDVKGWIRHSKAECPECDGGFEEGPLTEPQADGSRRTTLRVNSVLQRAAHLDLLPLLLLGTAAEYTLAIRVDQVCTVLRGLSLVEPPSPTRVG